MGFSRQEYYSELPFPSPEDLSYSGIEPMSLTSPALAGRFFTANTTWEVPDLIKGPLCQDRARRKAVPGRGKSRHRLPKTQTEDMKKSNGEGV